MWNFADDYGVLEDDPGRLRLQILPVDPVNIEDLLDELLKRGRVRRAETKAGQKVLVIPNFGKHQKVDKRSEPRFGAPDSFRYPPQQGIRGVPPSPVEPSTEMGVKKEKLEGEVITPQSPSGSTPLPTPQRVVDVWNEERGPLAQARTLTSGRRRKIEIRSATDRDETWWRGYFRRIASSSWCRGDNPRGWKADLDWAVSSEEVVVKVLESGRYDDRASPEDLPKATRNALAVLAEIGGEEPSETRRGGERLGGPRGVLPEGRLVAADHPRMGSGALGLRA